MSSIAVETITYDLRSHMSKKDTPPPPGNRTTLRYYAMHRLIDAASNYPTYYIHHIADMLVRDQQDPPQENATADQCHNSLPDVPLSIDRIQSHSIRKKE